MSAPRDFAKSVTLVCLAGAGLVAFAPAALAQERPVVVYADPSENIRTSTVSFADLDLASAKGAKRLHHRVSKAVKQVCLFEPDGARLQPVDYYDCADASWTDARPKMAEAISRAQSIALNGGSPTVATAITISAFGR